MIRALHRRFLWNVYALSCIFLLIVFLSASTLIVRSVDDTFARTLRELLSIADSDPTVSIGARMQLPAYVIEVRASDPNETALADGDTVELLRGDPSAWSEETLRNLVNEMLESERPIDRLRQETLYFSVERTKDKIRIAAIEYESYRALIVRVGMSETAVYLLIAGTLFLLYKLAEIRLLRPAERAWTNQERFVEDASHEMKTPLAVILSNAELGVSDKPEETEKRFTMILNEARRMKLLITRMLESARIENNAAKHLNDTVFSLSDAVTECVLRYEEPLYERGIALAYDAEDGLSMLADEAILKQALCAILENAGKYTPKGRSVSVSVKKVVRYGVITVRNSGIGLDAHARESIFERFYRADEARTREESSYGLGLSIAQNLIETMNGRIRCDSDGETYTAFVITLPLTGKKGAVQKVCHSEPSGEESLNASLKKP